MTGRGTGHGPCTYEREILALWDNGHSRQQIMRITGYSSGKVESALGLNEDGGHRRHCAAQRLADTAFVAALQAAR